MNSKGDFRKELKGVWESLNRESLEKINAETYTTILKQQEWVRAEIILAYKAFGSEISLDALIRKALQTGKEVYLPRVNGQKMTFHTYHNDSPLTRSSWGIYEPEAEAALFDTMNRKSCLLLLPGLGFAPDGRRMGRGGGYYDRFLEDIKGNKNICTLGICHDLVLRDEIPTEEHDKTVDFVCSQTQWIHCAANARQPARF